MTTAIITTPQRGLDKGVVSDTNYIEYPPNSAEEMVNLVTLPDGVVERRPGLAISSPHLKWSSSTSNVAPTHVFYWEPEPGDRRVVRVTADSLGGYSTVCVNDSTVEFGRILGIGHSTNVTYARNHYTQNPPGTGTLVASTPSVWFNNVEHQEHTTVFTADPSFVYPLKVSQYYDKGGVRYIREFVVNCAATIIPPPDSAPEITQTIQFAASKNFLVITSPMSLPVVIWKSPSGAFKGDVIDIVYRSYEDEEDGVVINERPGSGVSNAKLEQNLLNRGWTPTTLTSYKTAIGVWPAKTMVPWKGKNSTGAFDAAELNKIFFGTGSAPIGSQLRSLVIDKGTVPTATCATHGRVWYAGFGGPVSGQMVAYTQTITNSAYPAAGVATCYSFNDPTAEYFNQPTALDGGIITIEGAKNVLAIKAFKDGVIVFAENGVWVITGAQGQAFQGNAFDLYKLTDEGAICAGGISVTEDFVLYWTRTGINRIDADQQSRSLVVKSLTDGRLRDSMSSLIKSFQETMTRTIGPLGNFATRYHPVVWAANDATEKRVYFSFGQSYFQISQARIFTVSGAFTRICNTSITPSTTMWVYDYVKDAFYQYVVGAGPETLASDWVGGHVFVRDNLPYKFSSGPTGTEPFRDVATFTGAWPPTVATYADYSSYAVISTKNALVDPDKQLSAVHLSFENSNYGTYPSNTDGSCYMSVIFDNYTAVDSKRTSPEQQAYRHVPGKIPDYSTGNFYRVVKTKLSVRGHGAHYRIKLRSESNKNFKFIGYALDVRYPATELRRIGAGGGGEN